MNIHILQQYPIPLQDLETVAYSLRQRDVIHAFVNRCLDWYDPMCYERERALTGLRFAFLLDRNVYTRIVALANSNGPPKTELHRAAAALVCFASCCSISAEPILAALEHELDSGSSKFGEELVSFRRAASAHPGVLADFALGRRFSLKIPSAAEAEVETHGIDPPAEANRPQSWWLNYGCALKLACLLLDVSIPANVERFLSFIDWCYDSYFFSAGATVYGSLALSPRRRRGMFKGLRGTGEERILRGVRNAAWDMTLILEWEEHHRDIAETGTYYLLCSFDKALADAAGTVITQGIDADAGLNMLQERFQREWGRTDGRRVFDRYRELGHTVNSNASRPANQQLPHEHWKRLLAELETELKDRIA